MPTEVPIGSALARKLFSVATFAATQRMPSLRRNMTGPAPKQTDAERKLKGQTSPDYPFVRITDLSKTAGEQVSIDLFNILRGKPIMGDRKISGKMMSLNFSSMNINIDQYRGGVDPGGRMTQQRTLHNLRSLSKANLAGWSARLEDQLALVHSAGTRGFDNAADWVVPLQADADFATIVVNAVNPPTSNRRRLANTSGAVTSTANLTSTDLLTLDEIDKFRAQLDEEVFPLQPIHLEGDESSYENPLFCFYVTSRQWNDLQINTTAPAWRTFLADAHARSQGFKHPLFMGSPGMWNGILVKKMSRAIRFSGGDIFDAVLSATDTPVSETVVTITGQSTDRAVLYGAQALAEVYGRHGRSGYYANWHEELTDHGNTLETSIAFMGGKAKVRFTIPSGTGGADKLTDHGCYVFDSQAVAP